MEVTAACAGGICFCGCSQRRGDGRCWLVHRRVAITRRGRSCVRVPVGLGLAEAARMEAPVGFASADEGDGRSSVRRWDLAAGKQRE